MLNVVRTVPQTPIAFTRQFALFNVAIYDAVTTIMAARGGVAYEPYRSPTEAPAGDLSCPAAVGGAAHEVLTHLHPEFTTLFDTRLADTLDIARSLEGDVSRGEEWGRRVASGLIDERLDDGHLAYDGGSYQACDRPAMTPGCYRGGQGGPWLDAHFAFVDTWAITNPMPFGRPPWLTDDAYAEAWHEVYHLGDNRRDRPQEEIDIATFWRGGGGTSRPPGRWMGITSIAATEFHLSLLETARLFGLVSLAIADAGISSWLSKYKHGFWRPLPAIRYGDTDDNPETFADPGWQPIAIGGSPEYPSTLSCYGATAKTILIDYLETDSFTFEFTSSGPPEQTRTFNSFSGAFEESWHSRLYVGNHFRFSLVDSIPVGEAIAQTVLDDQLQPIE